MQNVSNIEDKLTGTSELIVRVDGVPFLESRVHVDRFPGPLTPGLPCGPFGPIVPLAPWGPVSPIWLSLTSALENLKKKTKKH